MIIQAWETSFYNKEKGGESGSDVKCRGVCEQRFE